MVGGRRTFEPSAPKVRTDEDERSGKCGIQVGMFLGRSSYLTRMVSADTS